MKTQTIPSARRDKASLLQRVRYFYRFFNERDWPRCHAYVDPKLRGKHGQAEYGRTMDEFFSVHGPLRQMTVVSTNLYPAGAARTDDREFAYVVLSWKDRANALHHFRERWVRDGGRWFTRVVGLVPRPAER
ncbi:MAG TPA: hypothetical protein VGH33_17705 [Isosphaeraceae bacterium]|jgi:hypothetical protein